MKLFVTNLALAILMVQTFNVLSSTDAASTSARTCGANEELSTCGTPCEKTCANRLENLACIAVCKKGCFCKQGFVRNNVGTCTSIRDCPAPTCPNHETYNKCGTACPLTCDNYRNNSKVCTAQCVEACFCDVGYVRNHYTRCVKPNADTCKKPGL